MDISKIFQDVMFEVLFEDEGYARRLLSALLNEDVLSVKPLPGGESRVAAHKGGPESLIRAYNFTAVTHREKGSDQPVLIAVRKDACTQDVQQFRHRMDTSDAIPEDDQLNQEARARNLPIVTIHFLEEGLAGVDAPVLRLGHPCLDLATGEEVHVTDPSAEAFAPDTIVVQADRLKRHRRTALERLLAVFDPSLVCSQGNRQLEIHEADFPDKFLPVLARLKQAATDPEVLGLMLLEDVGLDTGQ